MAASNRLNADVLVLGAGPAACTLALNLAPQARVLLVDKALEPVAGLGESLPAAAGRLLRDMGLQQAFLQQGHPPCYSTRSTWGTDQPMQQDALRNLDGPGWHLDRPRFDAWLATVAQARGAALLQQTRILRVHPRPDEEHPWCVALQRQGRTFEVQCRVLVDASGRGSWLARHLGAQRRVSDKLVCGWLLGKDRADSDGISDLWAEAQGWWYSAALPGGQRLVNFYTDADLPAAASAHSGQALLARLADSALPHLLDPGQAPRSGFCAAHSARLDRCCGTGWLAVGDAALAFDPLSAQGLFNALYTGLAGAETAYRCLQGQPSALTDYAAELNRIEQAYTAHLGAWYQQEQRWQQAPFWQRRQVRAVTAA
ncbi:MAG: FAD-dependent monooxygenase [Candidatus Pseudomonas colombiensis]|nr:MAG: FAD-dependent monooxygenase [Pseudomonas sp.]